MLYEEARVYLDQASKYGSVLGLESISNLLKELDNPQDALTFIHIAGTNGKGSILAYMSAILQEDGYKVGRYISPTVLGYLERFQINGTFMAEYVFGDLMDEIQLAIDRMKEKGYEPPTVFEIETAIAFLYFKKEKCDYVLLETGLGGRLDATNIVQKVEVCVFSSISMDHMHVLGETLEAIAAEKAGIIKPGASVVMAPQEESVVQVLQKASNNEAQMVEKARLTVERRNLQEQIFSYKEFRGMKIQLLGVHQMENAATALEIVLAMRKRGVDISERAVREGLAKAVWPGRFQVLQKEPLLIIDGAHNEDAAKRLAENLDIYLPNSKVIGIMGVFKDKEYGKIIRLMKPYLDYVYTIELPNSERTLSKEELAEQLRMQGVKAEAAASVGNALEQAKQRAKTGQAVLAFGSLSYLGQLIELERR